VVGLVGAIIYDDVWLPSAPEVSKVFLVGLRTNFDLPAATCVLSALWSNIDTHNERLFQIAGPHVERSTVEYADLQQGDRLGSEGPQNPLIMAQIVVVQGTFVGPVQDAICVKAVLQGGSPSVLRHYDASRFNLMGTSLGGASLAPTSALPLQRLYLRDAQGDGLGFGSRLQNCQIVLQFEIVQARNPLKVIEYR
jgi:hypothetical protein